MSVRGMPEALLEELTPEAVCSYADRTGWKKKSASHGEISYEHSEFSPELVIPDSRRAKDYARRIGLAVATLADLEVRDPNVLLQHLIQAAVPAAENLSGQSQENALKALAEGVDSWNDSRRSDTEGKPNLAGADLSHRDLRGIDFHRSILTRTNLRHARLREADLRESVLREAELTAADLTLANLTATDLSSASLRGARLKRAILHDADLRGASLVDADLTEADLSGADLLGVRDLHQARLSRAILSGARLPNSGYDANAVDWICSLTAHAGRVWLVLVAVCIYALLIIAGTTDAALFLDSMPTRLPLIGTAVPLRVVYMVLPVVLAVLHLFTYLYASRLSLAVSELPAVLPDGTDVFRRVPMSLFTVGSLARNRRAGGAYDGLLYLHIHTSYLVVMGVAPLVILCIGLRTLVIRDLWLATPAIVALSLFVALHLTHWVCQGSAWLTQWMSRRSDKMSPAGADGPATSETVEPGRAIQSSPENPSAPIGVPAPKFAVFARVVPFAIYLLLFGGAWGLQAYGYERSRSNSRLRADLRGAHLSSLFRGADLSGKDLRFARLDGLIATDTDFRGTNLMGADLHQADLTRANLQGAKLTKGNLERIKLAGANLTDTDLEGAKLAEANLKGVDLTGANLVDADLKKADLSYARLDRALLMEARFELANLAGASFAKADLTQADLQRANLKAATFYGADLTGADLQLTNLEGVYFVDAKLLGADLTDANLAGANLRNASLQGATLGFSQFDRATRFPSGFNPMAKGMKPLEMKTQ